MILNSESIQDARLAQQYLDIAEVLIMALDENYNVTMINQKGVLLLGYPKEEIIGKNFMEHFVPSRMKEEIREVGKDIIEDTQEFQSYYENPILTKSGEERLIAWSNTQLKDKDGNSIGILTSGEDITGRRKQNQQILQKSRLEQMGEMMSMVAHQWRQPLGAISAVSAGLLIKLHINEFELEKEKGIDRLKTSLVTELEKINLYVQNLSNIIDDFKNFYKVDKKLELLFLDEVVESALNIISGSIKDSGTVLKKEVIDASQGKIFYSEMIQVILSILQNALDNFEEKK